MRLSDIIIKDLESILADFEEFARTHTGAGPTMDVASLRDHAEAMLRAFVRDMGRPQTNDEQRMKARGDAPPIVGLPETAAQQHGTDRAGRGFTLEEMFAEYRALRASVLRRYGLAGPVT